MAHIDVTDGVPGIRSLFMFRPETGKVICELVQVLLRGESPLSPAERELIAAHVSNRNECVFCTNSHAAAAECLYESNALVDQVLRDVNTAALSVKMKALLNIAGKVQVSGRNVTREDVAAARNAGADDREIHDTVLIAATFCMCNRYVDGLAALTPPDRSSYKEMGIRMAEHGYAFPR
jgi:uncharacterized peroxidase-related enzyme